MESTKLSAPHISTNGFTGSRGLLYYYQIVHHRS